MNQEELNIESLSDTSESSVSEISLSDINYSKNNVEYNIEVNTFSDDIEVNTSSSDDEIDEEELETKINQVNQENRISYLFYNEYKEIQKENDAYNYHLCKNTGDWLIAKTIVSYSKDKSNSEFFWDYLDLLFKENNDNFDNIDRVIYSSNDTVFEFDTTISKYIVDNLKICKYKPNGYIFNNNESNTWSFKIVVITNTNVYSANRYIDETKIGCF